MPKKTLKPQDAPKVWIELPKPASKEEAERNCTLANNMLQRLCGPDSTGSKNGLRFFWSEHSNCYCFGGQMGYTTLSDRGEWFNLSYLGRPLEEKVVA